MRQPKYKIVMSGVKDCLFYRTKREVQKHFNKLLRSYKKDENYIVTTMNEGWFKYTSVHLNRLTNTLSY